MKINSIKIKNFRNLNDVQISFHPDTNYIIGENNIGKSNLLFLMNVLFSGKGFDENDFTDTDSPIEIELSMKLVNEEMGFFNDYFSPTDPYLVNLKIEQRIDDVYPSMYHIESGDSLPYKLLKKAHYINYNTNAVPDKSLRFDAPRGLGPLFKSITSSYIQTNGDISFLDEEKINELKNFINEPLKKIHSFNLFSVEASIVEQPSDVLAKLFSLSNGNYNINEAGCGVQFMAMASVNILCQIMDIYKKKGSPFSEQLYEVCSDGADGKTEKILPLILAIDEPEVHLHPFLQRSLIGYYKKLLNNQDGDFCSLIKMLFGIDGLSGQLLIVTHSTDALIDDYRNLIRFYKKNGNTIVVSGYSLNTGISPQIEKHLIMHFPEVREVFYSRCSILIEGETEFGCMRDFSAKLGVSLDESQISIINAHGQGSIKPFQILFEKFGIPSVIVYDSDVREGKDRTDRTFFTNELCFEVELVKYLYTHDQIDLVKKIALDMDSNAMKKVLTQEFGTRWYGKLGVSMDLFVPKKIGEIAESNQDEFCNMYSAWFMSQKGILFGRTVGKIIPREMIPPCYANAVLFAQRLSNEC